MLHRALLPLLLLCASHLLAQRVTVGPNVPGEAAFAIIVDRATHDAARGALLAYQRAVEADGLPTWLIADAWPDPEAVRAAIEDLRRSNPPIEGVALVGAIPIPMIRDAQHLTSAFKMDQLRSTWQRTSVPSDRFYDDLDLRFDRLKQDEEKPLLWYYSLRADSPERIEKDIYSARILPGEAPDIEKLKSWIEVVVRRKRERRPLRDALTVTGHGYNSESLTAWESMIHGLREQLPSLHRPGGRIRHLHHKDDPSLKRTLLRELQSPTLNLLVVHAHGAEDKQYLSEAPPETVIDAQIEVVKRTLRHRLRRAKKRDQDPNEEKKALQERLGVPDSWFEGAFDAEITAADDRLEKAKDIHVGDLTGIAPNPEVVIFDECFNGCFIADEYIAGAYVFAGGGTVAAVANTVNVLQDIWADEHLGLLAEGIRVGAWHRLDGHLESHLIGDPTFRFALPRWGGSGPALLDADRERLLEALDLFLGSAVLRGLALRRLARSPAPPVAELLRRGREDGSDTLRLLALKELARLRVPELIALLDIAVRDPSEMIRRQAVRLMGDVGLPEHLPALLAAVAADVSPRVVFQAKTALQRFPPASINETLDAGIEGLDAEQIDALRNEFGKGRDFLCSNIEQMADRALSVRRRLSAIRTFRLYRLQDAIPALLARAAAEDEEIAVRRAALEALGWYGLSRHRAHIEARARAIAAREDVPEGVRSEALKTANRLATGPGDPFTP